MAFIETGVNEMNLSEALQWVRYWKAAKMVGISNIGSVPDANLAIKYCECLRVGVATGLTPV
jgi:hypothetical protein